MKWFWKKKSKESFAKEVEYNSFEAPVSLEGVGDNLTGKWSSKIPCYVEKTPPCEAGCPTSSNIERWIALIEKDNKREAFKELLTENPFPSIMGRICSHPCHKVCNRSKLGGAVNIKMLERFVADQIDDKFTPQPYFGSQGKKVVVIGAGLSGLSTAYHLRRLGYEVVILEKDSKAGGVLNYGVPAFRLPRDVLARELKRIERMGIVVKLSSPIKDASHFQSMRQDYSAIVLATGAGKSMHNSFMDVGSKDVCYALDFLRDISHGVNVQVGKSVIVYGGGNAAVDSARTAVRLGAQSVKVLFDETPDKVSALIDEVQRAKEEGVEFEFQIRPTKIITRNRSLKSIKCESVSYADSEDYSRTVIVPVGGSEKEYNADTLIMANGEHMDSSIIPSILHIENDSIVNSFGGQTKWKDLFVVGDVGGNPRSAVYAMESGKRTAIAIDCSFRQLDFEDVVKKITTEQKRYIKIGKYVELINADESRSQKDDIVAFDELNLSYFESSKTKPIVVLPKGKRTKVFDEVYTDLDLDKVKAEMARCFHCGRCVNCDNCYIYCPDNSVKKDKGRYQIDEDYCKGCGICVNECPRSAMQFIEKE